MPKCTACNKEMKIHEDGFFDKVWRCEKTPSHPTVTTSGDGRMLLRVGSVGLGVAAFLSGQPHVAAALFGSALGDGDA